MNSKNLHILREMAAKYIWWETPDHAVSRPARVVTQVMNIGDFEDVQRLVACMGESSLRDIVQAAEAGQFNARSWAYWHYRLGLAEPGGVPSLPVRKIQ